MRWIGNQVRKLARNVPWPIKGMIDQLPPIEMGNRSPYLTLVLGTRKTEDDALWALYSYAYFAKFFGELIIAIDQQCSVGFSRRSGRYFARRRSRRRGILPQCRIR